jgi:sugar phosphate isomerase/epimerase
VQGPSDQAASAASEAGAPEAEASEAAARSAGRIPVVLSTASVYPERVPDAFEAAAHLGYDGIEIMVTTDPVSQDIDVLRRLSDYHHIPVLAVHSPCLLATRWVWGTEPWGKLNRTREVAEKLGAKVAVVHPPFRWQREYVRDFERGMSDLAERTSVKFAVENLYSLPWRDVTLYAPNWNPAELDVPYTTLDLSHTAVSGSDALDLAGQLGDRLAHVHMADGFGPGLPDPHLIPGRGTQPCAELLARLGAAGFGGMVVVEVNTRRATKSGQRRADLAEALEFTRRHLAAGVAGKAATRQGSA